MAEEKNQDTASAPPPSVLDLSEGKAIGERPIVVVSMDAAPGLPNVPYAPAVNSASASAVPPSPQAADGDGSRGSAPE